MSIDPPLVVPTCSLLCPPAGGFDQSTTLYNTYPCKFRCPFVCWCTSVLLLVIYICIISSILVSTSTARSSDQPVNLTKCSSTTTTTCFLATTTLSVPALTPCYITCPDQSLHSTIKSHDLSWYTRQAMLNGSSHSYEHVPDTFAYPLLPPHTLTIRRNHRTHARALRGIDFVRPVAGPSRPRQMEARKRRTGNNMDRPSSPKKPRTTDIDESPGSSRSGCEQDQHIPTHATHQHQHHHHRRASVPVDTAGPADSADRVRAETSRAAYAHHRESTGDSPDLDTLLDQTCPNERARSLAPSVDGYDSGLNTPARPQCVWKRRSGIENGLTGWPRAVGLWRRSLTTHSRGGSLDLGVPCCREQ